MSIVEALSEADLAFLEAFLPRADVSRSGLPFVTLTYASSLDSMISLGPGLRTTLSGPETKNMTHYLRSKHQAILVGVGTAIPDDPGLNCRYPGATTKDQPQPVIIDPRGRWSYPGSKLEDLVAQSKGKAPWIVRSSDYDGVWASETVSMPKLISLPPSDVAGHGQSSIDWISILRALKERDIHSVMVEGGATVISTLLKMPEVVNSVIITIAPTWLGKEGVFVSPASTIESGVRVNAASLRDTQWRQFGQDAVLCGRLGAS